MNVNKETLDIISVLSNFLPRNEDDCLDPIFSKEFLLKNILGLSDEEYKLNEKLIKKEKQNF